MSIDVMKLALEALEHEAQAGNDDAYRVERDALRAAIDQAQEPVAYTTGHCEHHKQKGGCQLHNLQCGWPDCDRKPITTQPQMQPCAGRNCGSTNPNLHSAECFEDYEKSTGMAQPKHDDPIGDAQNKLIAEQAQEPIAWVYPEGLEALKGAKPWTAYGSNGDGRIPLYLDAVARRVEPPATESGAGFESLPASSTWWDDPVAKMQRKWQGLTDEEREQFRQWAHPDIIEAIELKLQERNT